MGLGDLYFQVPMTAEEVALCFSEQQEGLQGPKKGLCKQVAKGSRKTLGSPGEGLLGLLSPAFVLLFSQLKLLA